MDASRKYRVVIFGNEYSLVSNESEEAVFSSAQHVDELMKEISEKMAFVSKDKVAVLASLRLASQLSKESASLSRSEKKISSLILMIDEAFSSW